MLFDGKPKPPADALRTPLARPAFGIGPRGKALETGSNFVRLCDLGQESGSARKFTHVAGSSSDSVFWHRTLWD